jgi:hypothetical protein
MQRGAVVFTFQLRDVARVGGRQALRERHGKRKFNAGRIASICNRDAAGSSKSHARAELRTNMNVGIRRFARIRRLAGVAIAALTLIAATSSGADADTTAPLPFTPPTGWQTLPSAFLPTQVLTWSSGTSAFNIGQLSAALPIAQAAEALKISAGALGTVLSSSSPAVCGQPSEQIVIQMKNNGPILTEQEQVIDGMTYISTYSRAAGTSADPAITAIMASYCGSSSLAHITPPSGWQTNNIRILGVWLRNISENITVLSMDPRPDAAQLAHDALTTTVKTPDVTILSSKAGTLCGNPALFVTSNAKLPTGGELQIEVVTTQSSSAAYILVYSHPPTTPADPAATASLMTLCAGPPTATPPAAPSATP